MFSSLFLSLLSACTPEAPTPLNLGAFLHSHPGMVWELQAAQDPSCTFMVRESPVNERRTVQVTLQAEGLYAVRPDYRRTFRSEPPNEAFTTAMPVGYDGRSAFQVEWGQDTLDVYECSPEDQRWTYVGSLDIWLSMAHLRKGQWTEDQLFNHRTREWVHPPFTAEVDW